MVPAKKRIFIGLISLSLFFIGICIFVAYYLLINNNGVMHEVFLALTGVSTVIVIFSLGIGVFGLVLNLISEKNLPFLQKLMLAATNALFPIAVYVGKSFGMDKEAIKRSFIAVNNQLVRNQNLKLNPEDVVIIVPHCLQWSKCSHKITIDANNCKRCGKCPIGDLHLLTDKFGIKLGIASGGTLARKFIKENRPKAVVAIACERDLCSGIQDINLPVLGVLNIRPNGPCLNTDVDLELVENALTSFLKGDNDH